MASSPTARGRLWIASELYYPEETSTGYFVTRIAEGLADAFDVEVISGLPTYSERDVAVARFEERKGVRIHRMAGTRFDKDRLALRAINLVAFTLTAFWFALRRLRRGDVVMALTNPPTLPLAIAIAARVRGAKTALLVHDLYPEVLAATGLLRRGGVVYRMIAWVFSAIFRSFDRVYVLGRDMTEVVAAKLGDRADRIALIPNWGDVDEIAPVPRAANRIVAECGLAGKFIVQFSGNIGRTHDVEAVLDAAARLGDLPDVRFLIAGFGGKAAAAARIVEERGLGNVVLIPRQPRALLPDMLAASDLTVIAFVDDMYGISVPSRMYNVLAAGTPIAAIAHPRSELALMVRENRAGWVIGDADAPDLEALIRRLAGPGGGEAAERGANGRRAVVERYSLPHVLALFRAEFGALFGARRDR